MSDRLKRVEEAIKEEVAGILQRELKDPRLGFITVTRVRVSADLQHATVYFSVLEEKKAAETEAGLKSAQGFVRKLLGERLRLRVTPEILFRSDSSAAETIRISKLLGGLHKSENDA
ncbi:MAG: 30S ribosome-binding factor RbfA [Candidatus Omnitrophica bacterium]|nr:30S ribosome-binding factor RbfA [Candidatus Omnitrophota bacterium]